MLCGAFPKGDGEMLTTLNKNWRFHLGDTPEAWQKDYDDLNWDPVVVPHDWAVTLPFSPENSSGTGYLPGGTGWYRLHFCLPGTCRGKRLWVRFDGVYKNCQVWLNGYNLGKHAYGYTPFRFDITDFAATGEAENVLAVRVCHEDISDSRWYTGSGITRKVWLEEQEPVCFDEYGLVFTTPQVAVDGATVRVRATVENLSAALAQGAVCIHLRDTSGRQVLAMDAPLTLVPGERSTVTLEGRVPHPHLWSPDDPALYTLSSELLLAGRACNRIEEVVGIREAHFSPDTGFTLNGQGMKLKGVCLHHDGGCLGAAVPKPVWRRRLLKLKAAGCNAIRMSHNPHDPELYELCDELGFLVMDEAFDEWEGPKNKWSTGHNVYPPKHQGYAEDFPQWHEADLRAMVRRSRNHPCVILWSIGNEIDYPNDPYAHPSFGQMAGNNDKNKPVEERIYNPARPNMDRISTLAQRLAHIVREEDDTRPVCTAAAFPELSSTIGFFDALDVVGYNYMEPLYERDHQRFPHLPVLGSENHHSLAAWRAVTDHDYISGQFLWTGIDFLGEAHVWPNHGSLAGLLTLAGYEKPEFYFRQSLWARDPMVQLVTARKADNDAEPWPRATGSLCWDYTSGEEITVRCYTNCPVVDIRLNGVSQGIYRLADYAEVGYIVCTLAHEAGILEAVATAADGRRATSRLTSVSAPVAITAVADRTVLQADGEDVAQIEVTVVDKNGNWTPHASDRIEACVEGAATLLGIESGDQSDNTAYSLPQRRAYCGRLLVYVRATEQGGPIRVTLRTAGSLEQMVVELQAK